MQGARRFIVASFLVGMSMNVSASGSLYDELIGTWSLTLDHQSGTEQTYQVSFWPDKPDLSQSTTKLNVALVGVLSGKSCAGFVVTGVVPPRKLRLLSKRYGLRFPNNRPDREHNVYTINSIDSYDNIHYGKPSCQILDDKGKAPYWVMHKKSRRFALSYVSYEKFIYLKRATPNEQHAALLDTILKKEKGVSVFDNPLTFTKAILFTPNLVYDHQYVSSDLKAYQAAEAAADKKAHDKVINAFLATLDKNRLKVSKSGLTLNQRSKKRWMLIYDPIGDAYYHLYHQDYEAADKHRLFHLGFVFFVNAYGQLCADHIKENKVVITTTSWIEVRSRYAGTYNKDYHTTKITLPARYQKVYDSSKDYLDAEHKGNYYDVVDTMLSARRYIEKEGCDSDNVKQILENYYRAVSLANYKRIWDIR